VGSFCVTSGRIKFKFSWGLLPRKAVRVSHRAGAPGHSCVRSESGLCTTGTQHPVGGLICDTLSQRRSMSLALVDGLILMDLFLQTRETDENGKSSSTAV
jgi:hypothetical protein